jgi:hypothetical protein
MFSAFTSEELYTSGKVIIANKFNFNSDLSPILIAKLAVSLKAEPGLPRCILSTKEKRMAQFSVYRCLCTSPAA